VNERRQFARIPFFETIPIENADKEVVNYGYSLDLSAHGIGIKSDVPLRPQQDCLIEFALRFKNKICHIMARCEILNCGVAGDFRGYRIGLSFVDMQADDAESIAQFIALTENKGK
jgi:hypothetical protein